MYQEINEDKFRAAFEGSQYKNSFSHEGLGILFNYLTDLEEDVGQPLQLDVCAFACGYTESPLMDLVEQYNIEGEDDAELKGELEQLTTVCGYFDDEVSTHVVYEDF